MNYQQTPAPRGLAVADPLTRQRVARRGGRAVQASGHAHRLTSEERRRGGKNSPNNFAYRPQTEIQEIARRGGEASHKKTPSRAL